MSRASLTYGVSVVDSAQFKYRALLSYSHRDVGWARWLHARLEGFHFDKDLIGRDTTLGPVPNTLRPIFRDREDFSGGQTLTDATVAALDASPALIVLCSSLAASRPAVNEEVRLFRSRHPERPVIPVIVDGAAPDNFPPARRPASRAGYEFGGQEFESLRARQLVLICEHDSLFWLARIAFSSTSLLPLIRTTSSSTSMSSMSACK